MTPEDARFRLGLDDGQTVTDGWLRTNMHLLGYNRDDVLPGAVRTDLLGLNGHGEQGMHPRHTALQPCSQPSPTTFADIAPERVEWLWDGRLPVGKLVVIDGDPGAGKSTLGVELAAHVSTGNPWPDGTACPHGRALLLTAEDGLADTVSPRLHAAMADVSRVMPLPDRVVEDVPRPVTFPTDHDHLHEFVETHEITLVVIDPLSAYLHSTIDFNNDASMRQVLRPLAIVAEQTSSTIVAVRHVGKGQREKAIHSGLGSIATTAAARMAFIAAPDPDDEDRRLLAATKCNLAAKPSTLAYRLVNEPQYDVARIRWEGTADHSADELVRTPSAQTDKRGDAEAFLIEQLSEGPKAAKALLNTAHDLGLGERTVRSAKADLGVISQRDSSGRWTWSLPQGGKAARLRDRGACLEPVPDPEEPS